MDFPWNRQVSRSIFIPSTYDLTYDLNRCWIMYAQRTDDLFRGNSKPTIIVAVIVVHSIGTDFYVIAGTFDLSVNAC